ncbi:hypothetical protein XAC29_16085 [Xanthomonas axonopodis Xac29-1]|uniref:Uncharacterized protein n=1 Tax=Xanthomonas axonopodis pv. citri (strain 306) TaxID=190486 RepID=A0AAI8ETM7_XANAC|nr:hypothetical protein XAC3161 [Xanthomonas citri pv. citri str. 306]AGH78640.1 hypothetical protein XAC29_16085 [Xanthomonas axonopodis Xac29-1]AGI09221.1 Hypothetical protein XCAW_03447 [Xanthomonas citri subsp. citri Aw12879]
MRGRRQVPHVPRVHGGSERNVHIRRTTTRYVLAAAPSLCGSACAERADGCAIGGLAHGCTQRAPGASGRATIADQVSTSGGPCAIGSVAARRPNAADLRPFQNHGQDLIATAGEHLHRRTGVATLGRIDRHRRATDIAYLGPWEAPLADAHRFGLRMAHRIRHRLRPERHFSLTRGWWPGTRWCESMHKQRNRRTPMT